MQVLSEPGTMCSSNCKIHVENTGGGHTTSVALLSPISIFLLFFPFLSPESLSRAIRESKVRVFPSPIASARIPPLKGSGFEHVLELVNTLTNSPPSLSSQPHNALRRLQRVRDTLVRRQSLAKTPENLVHTLKHRISGGFFDSNDRYLKGGVVLGYEAEAAIGDVLSDSGEEGRGAKMWIWQLRERSVLEWRLGTKALTVMSSESMRGESASATVQSM
ncbi:hypothetical protein HN51_022191 [Arachis hypogaea]